MPVPLEYMDMTSLAMLWENSGASDREGNPTVIAPVEITCRWEEDQRESYDKNGNLVTTDVTICTTRNILIGSIIWEGGLTDLAAQDVGSAMLPVSDIYQVLFRSRAKSIGGEVVRYEFSIKRYMDIVPDIVT